MNTHAQNFEIAERLRSLTIVRDEPETKPSPSQAAPRQVRRWSRWILLALLAGASGAYVFVPAVHQTTDILLAAGMEKLAARVNTVTAAAPQKTDAPVQTTTIATPFTPKPMPAADVIGSGRIVAEREFTLRSEVTGRLIALPLGIGDRFNSGDLLAELDKEAADSDLQIAKAELARARETAGRLEVQLRQAKDNLARQQKLVKSGVVQATALDDARYAAKLIEIDLKTSQRDVEIQQFKLGQKKRTLEHYTLLAPFDGVVVSRLAMPGDIVSGVADSGGPDGGLMALLDLSSLIVEVDVAEANLGQLRLGQTAEVSLDAYPRESFAAHIAAISPKVAIQKGTVAVRLRFDSTPDARLLADMAAKVTFKNAKPVDHTIGKGG